MDHIFGFIQNDFIVVHFVLINTKCFPKWARCTCHSCAIHGPKLLNKPRDTEIFHTKCINKRSSFFPKNYFCPLKTRFREHDNFLQYSKIHPKQTEFQFTIKSFFVPEILFLVDRSTFFRKRKTFYQCLCMKYIVFQRFIK